MSELHFTSIQKKKKKLGTLYIVVVSQGGKLITRKFRKNHGRIVHLQFGGLMPSHGGGLDSPYGKRKRRGTLLKKKGTFALLFLRDGRKRNRLVIRGQKGTDKSFQERHRYLGGSVQVKKWVCPPPAEKKKDGTSPSSTRGKGHGTSTISGGERGKGAILVLTLSPCARGRAQTGDMCLCLLPTLTKGGNGTTARVEGGKKG